MHYRCSSEMCLENALNALKIGKRTPLMRQNYDSKSRNDGNYIYNALTFLYKSFNVQSDTSIKGSYIKAFK